MTTTDLTYRELVQNMHHGVAICETIFNSADQSPSYRITAVNPAFQSLPCCASKNPVGKNLHEVFPDLSAACGFARIWQNGSEKTARYFRVHFQNSAQDYLANILPLNRQETAIILFNLLAILGAYEKRLEDKPNYLRLHQSELDRVRRELNGANNAITVLAHQIDREKDKLEKKIACKVASQILPLVEELQQDAIPERFKVKLEVLSLYLSSLTQGVSKILSSGVSGDLDIILSQMELKVAMMIKEGNSTKTTAHLLHLSPETVKTHRRNIRRKLRIHNSREDLSTFLKRHLSPPT